MEAVIAISLWAAGALVAVGAPAAILFARWRSWTRLPRSGGYTKGLGPSLADVDEALRDFKVAWVARGLGPIEVEGMRVEWRAGDYFEERLGFRGEIVKLEGIARGPKMITVACAPGERLGRTAFFHELIHAVLQQQGTPDPDHDGDKYKGWTREHNELEVKLKAMWL